MDVWLLRTGQKFGPYSRPEIERWWRSGQLHPGDLIWHFGLASWVPPEQLLAASPILPASPAHELPVAGTNAQLIRRLADYEKISAWLWMGLGIVQVLTLVGAIAGIWNIFAAWTRFQIVPRIKARDPAIPSDYEGLGGIIIIGIINLLVGGAIGVLFAAFDVYVRDQVLSNRHLFDPAPAPSGMSQSALPA